MLETILNSLEFEFGMTVLYALWTFKLVKNAYFSGVRRYLIPCIAPAICFGAWAVNILNIGILHSLNWFLITSACGVGFASAVYAHAFDSLQGYGRCISILFITLMIGSNIVYHNGTKTLFCLSVCVAMLIVAMKFTPSGENDAETQKDGLEKTS